MADQVDSKVVNLDDYRHPRSISSPGFTHCPYCGMGSQWVIISHHGFITHLICDSDKCGGASILEVDDGEIL